jgi:hypothetical protein
LHWPQAGVVREAAGLPFRERRLLVNFSGNKTSAHPGELYSSRKRAIRYFETRWPESFDLYGPGWDGAGEAEFPSWRGVVPHKWEVYPRYRFGLCYENMRGEPGWISEKIFDCMRAGAVPIYLGAPNASSYIDAGAYIDRSAFGGDAELGDFLEAMNESEWQRYRAAAEAFLRSARFAPFLPQAFAATVLAAIGA